MADNIEKVPVEDVSDAEETSEHSEPEKPESEKVEKPSKEKPKKKAPKETHNITVGVGAGSRIKETAEFCILVGRNAGRHVTNAKRVVLIGDEFVGTNDNDQFDICEDLPTLEDIHIIRFLEVYNNIVATIKEKYTWMKPVQRKMVLDKMEELYDDAIHRLGLLQAKLSVEAEKIYMDKVKGSSKVTKRDIKAARAELRQEAKEAKEAKEDESSEEAPAPPARKPQARPRGKPTTK